ncbi:hypothetical protein CVT26_004521 [Gymnopilus dilepis]|uniref:F-box domain-containing protein n=1 Tax=Gymnopilus dilepis TaxID=231916 RepID=A0A409WF12_9AGAR|nr:hypothetical protein CVT26_004521 [Gymnopilus dilepis]
MKGLLRLSYFSRSDTRKTQDPQGVCLKPGNSVFDDQKPRLPGEIWRKIIRHTIRLAGADTVEPGNPFGLAYIDEEYPEVDSALFEDRVNLSLVNSSWKVAVSEISAEYLVIYSGKQLAQLADKFDAAIPVCHSLSSKLKTYAKSKTIPGGQKLKSAKPLGQWTTRIDFRILGPYCVNDVLRLIQCTPNLQIYVNNVTTDVPRRSFPTEIVDGLINYRTSSLRRIDWAGTGELPRYADLAKLCNNLPHLITLRLAAMHTTRVQDFIGVTPLISPRLRHLILGPDPRASTPRANLNSTWCLLFNSFCSNPERQIPRLEYFDCGILPRHWKPFFYLHGHKLQILRMASLDDPSFLPKIVEYCPNLKALLISQKVATPVKFPAFHPSLTKICICPNVDSPVTVPDSILSCAVMESLDDLLLDIERMVAPCLVELRIWGTGPYAAINKYSLWLRSWWLRWNLRGVQFLDKTGSSYKDICDRVYRLFAFTGKISPNRHLILFSL